MNTKKKVIVLLSGGIDSVVALHWAAKHHEIALALSFDYGSNLSQQELECAKWQAEKLGVKHSIVDIRGVGALLDSPLMRGAEAVPNGDTNDEVVKQSIVPFRNGIFLAIAAGIAESCGANAIVIAARPGRRGLYPDCRGDFLQAMQEAMHKGQYASIDILYPFLTNRKAEMLAIGAELGVDFAHTYSCYKGTEKHCGECATCCDRKKAFTLANIPDPTPYQN